MAAVDRGDKDARRVELMGAKFGHQSAAGPIPKPPADQFLDGGAVVHGLALGVFKLQVFVAVFFCIDRGVFDLGLDLRDPLRPVRRRFVVVLFQLIEFFGPIAEVPVQHVGQGIVGFCALGIGCCQLSLPGRLPRCHWARM